MFSLFAWAIGGGILMGLLSSLEKNALWRLLLSQ